MAKMAAAAKIGGAVKALELGAYAVVVGTAITRPQEITKRFTQAVYGLREKLLQFRLDRSYFIDIVVLSGKVCL